MSPNLSIESNLWTRIQLGSLPKRTRKTTVRKQKGNCEKEEGQKSKTIFILHWVLGPPESVSLGLFLLRGDFILPIFQQSRACKVLWVGACMRTVRLLLWTWVLPATKETFHLPPTLNVTDLPTTQGRKLSSVPDISTSLPSSPSPNSPVEGFLGMACQQEKLVEQPVCRHSNVPVPALCPKIFCYGNYV